MEYSPQKFDLPSGVSIVKNKSLYECRCSCCSHSALLRPLLFSRQFELILRAIDNAQQELKTAVPLSVIKKNPVAYTIYKRIKYWDLIDFTEDGGVYITIVGARFLSGIISIPEKIWIFRDMVRKDPEGFSTTFVRVGGTKTVLFNKEKLQEESITLLDESQYKLL